MSRSLNLFRYSALALAASTLMACSDGDFFRVPADVDADTFVLTSGNRLVGFAALAPADTESVTLAVPATETLLGGDFRPADGQLYIVTKVTADNALKVYVADASTGTLGTAIPLLNNGNGAGGGTVGSVITLTGTKVGVDFNPVANALRIVDSSGANLRTTLGSGNNTFIDAAIPGGIAESAYTNSFAATCQTDLYHINGTQLLLSAAPNGVATSAAAGGRLVGSLGVTADAFSGFDILTSSTGSARNVLIAALRVSGTYGIYSINPDTGAATNFGNIGGIGGDNVLGLVTKQPATAPTNAVGNALAITGGTTQSLLSFNRPPQGSPAKLCSSTAITGLDSGEVIVGADTRPATGALTALAKNGTGGTLYTINTTTGLATTVAQLTSGSSPLALTGSSFGVDFNPVPDRLRVVGDDGQNLRINVETGATMVDTVLSSTGVSAAAYTNSIFDGGTALTTQSTTLYGVDSSTDNLVLIGANPATGGGCVTDAMAMPPTTADAGNPNCGVVTSLGALGVDVGIGNGLEIEPRTGTAFMVATVGASTTLYTVNLGTGAATAAGNFAEPIVALTGNGALTATVFGVTPTNKLVSFLPDNPAAVTAIGTLSVPSGETVQGIDFRPSIGPKNGTLVALTTAAGGAAKLYVVNPADATVTALSSLAANAMDTSAPYTAVAGAAFGIDFNPMPDALRTVSNTQENLRSNPDNGATFTDGDLSVNGVYAAGYTNSFSSTGSTALFYLRDVASGNTTLQSTTAPNDGTLVTVGTDLGFDFSTVGDIDIAGGQNGFVLGALQVAGATPSGLYRINLASGVASKVGADIATAGSEPLVGIAIQLK